MNTANLKLLTIAGITASSLICLPAMAKDNHGNGHGNAKGNSAHISKDYKHSGNNAHPNINAYRHASPNASFKRGLDKYDYRVLGKIDRNVYDRSVVLNRNEDGYVRIRTPENQVVTVINDTLQIIDILSR